MDRLLKIRQVLNLGKIFSAQFVPRSIYSQVPPGLFSTKGIWIDWGGYPDISNFDKGKKIINEEGHQDGDGRGKRRKLKQSQRKLDLLATEQFCLLSVVYTPITLNVLKKNTNKKKNTKH